MVLAFLSGLPVVLFIAVLLLLVFGAAYWLLRLIRHEAHVVADKVTHHGPYQGSH